MNTIIQNYYSGTSGLLLPVPNKQFYPEAYKEKSRLCYYASLMNTIEINSSFYKIPQASTIKKWATDVPETFKFTFKLFKGLTHNKHLAFDTKDVSRFMEVISNVDEKKGCLLVQFPPSIRIDHFTQIELLMSLLRDNNPDAQWKIAVEFRHPSLYVEELYEILESYQMAMVIHDKSPASSPLRDSKEDFIYLRFHGPEENYRGTYTDDVLEEYANYIAEWLLDGKKVFMYFNNTMGNAVQNLDTLRQKVLNADVL